MQCPTCKTELIPVIYDETGREVYWICHCIIPGTVVAGEIRAWCMQSYKLVDYKQGATRCQPQPK